MHRLRPQTPLRELPVLPDPMAGFRRRDSQKMMQEGEGKAGERRIGVINFMALN